MLSQVLSLSFWLDLFWHCRCGMTISYNGMKPTTVELVCLGYHPTKCGNQTLCYSTSKYPSSLHSRQNKEKWDFILFKLPRVIHLKFENYRKRRIWVFILPTLTFFKYWNVRAKNWIWMFVCSADGNYEVRYKSNVLIYPDGEVLWVPPAIYQVNIICPFNCWACQSIIHSHTIEPCVCSVYERSSRVRPDACMAGPSRPPKKLLLPPCHPSLHEIAIAYNLSPYSIRHQATTQNMSSAKNKNLL